MPCHCGAGGHAPRSTGNILEQGGHVAAPGLSCGDGAGRGARLLPGDMDMWMAQCVGESIRRVRQLRALAREDRSSTGAAGWPRAGPVWQSSPQVCVEPVLWVTAGRGTGTARGPAGVVGVKWDFVRPSPRGGAALEQVQGPCWSLLPAG